eukprot:CAMPEP_0178967324 /NCGR_PEP_ID=MMETSP0789-20121207/17517_1 /TAXON_ID=3005 /ORGANISM="Rhizosolenia setigera, Strain CCMP 1694" /LENGTH=71 /DNA_ID=CAMNT_0020652893 /DNA_START=292 /DNA_END=507 /DNA_ORIENTATION=-
MMMLILFMTLMPTSESKVAREGITVLEKMKMIPAAIELRMTDVNITDSSLESKYHFSSETKEKFSISPPVP